MNNIEYFSNFENIKPEEDFLNKTLDLLIAENEKVHIRQKARAATIRTARRLSVVACLIVSIGLAYKFGINKTPNKPLVSDTPTATTPNAPIKEKLNYNDFGKATKDSVRDALYMKYKGRDYEQLILNRSEKSNTWWFNIERFNKEDFGDYLGTVSSDINDFNEFSSFSSDLAGAEFYIYTPMNCEAVLIAKKDDMCSLFQISQIPPEGYTVSDIFAVYGVKSSQQINNVKVIQKTHFSENNGVEETSNFITSKEEILDFYNAVLSLTKSTPEDIQKLPSKDKDSRWLFYQIEINLTNGLTLYMNYEPSTGLISYICEHSLIANDYFLEKKFFYNKKH